MKIKMMLLFTAFYAGIITPMDEDQPVMCLADIAQQEAKKWFNFIDVDTVEKPFAKVKHDIEQELVTLREEADKKEKTVMDAFRNKFPATDAAWNNFEMTSVAAQLLNKQYMGEMSYVPAKDEEHLAYIQDRLRQKGINPACIELELSQEKTATQTFIKVKSPMSHEVKFMRDAMQFTNNAACPGKYTIYTLLFEKIKDKKKQKLMCDTMIYYILEQTSAKRKLLLDFLLSCSTESRKNIRKLQEWKDLDIAHDMKVFIRFCLENPEQVELLCAVAQERCIDASVFRVICQMSNWLSKKRWLENKLKQDPLLQSITLKEFELWEKRNGYPLILPLKSCDGNPFYVLETKTFDRYKHGINYFYKENDVANLLDKFFDAIIKKQFIYEHIASESGMRIRQLTREETNLEELEKIYGKETIDKAFAMIARYCPIT